MQYINVGRGWLLVGCTGFNATLTPIMVVGKASVFPGFLKLVLRQLFQSHLLFFSHASAEVRGKNTQERKFTSTGYGSHNHQVMSPPCSPLSHQGGCSVPSEIST